MPDRNIEKAQWGSFCDRISRQVRGAPTDIETAGLRIGDQVQAEWARLEGITYDPKDDLMEVTVEGLDHLIREPRTFAARHDGARIESLLVATADGEKHIVRFRQPLALAAPSSH